MASNREREELHKAIWSIADDLRGAVDGWDFKQYILGIMFYRYISENITNYINEGERKAGDTSFDYAKLSDSEAEYERDNLVKEKGFFIRPSELFCNVIKSAKSDNATFTDIEGKTKNIKDNLNEYLEMIFNNIENSAKGAESEDDFSGLFDDIDVNSNKLGATVAKRNEKLVKILDGIAGIKLGNYKDNNIDAFGDAYEFLMSMYASNAGKSGGEYYTPQEVSELLTKLAIVGKTSVNKVYDPACGSGSLLLKSAKILGKDNVRNGFFGQELNLTTYNLCRINMFLHDIDYDKFDIACEDTLITPMHWDDEPFEVIVSNPPYSVKWAGDDNAMLINDPRYSPAGVLAPKSKADFAFIMHSLAWLASNGTASIVCFPGILYRTGAEQKIRKYLIDNNFIDCIIQLPENLFFGTSIATCIMVLKKNKIDNSTLVIDASKEAVKVTNNNRLTDENIENILKIFENREDVQYVSRLVSNKEIEEKNYNLSVSTYVEKEDTREVIDIKELNKQLDEIVKRENILRDEISKIIAEIELDELIQELCPDGVEYKKLGEICNISRGRVMSKDYIKNNIGQFPVYSSQTENNGELGKIATYDFDGEYLTWTTDGANAGSVFYRNGKFSITNVCGLIKVKNELVNTKYLYYALTIETHKYVNLGMGNPKLMSNVMVEVKVPVPPLEVQCEIVRILGKFTLLTAELTAELTARQKQYEYYRDLLLNFKKGDGDE